MATANVKLTPYLVKQTSYKNKPIGVIN